MNWPTQQQPVQWPQPPMIAPVVATKETAICGITNGRITIIGVNGDSVRFPTQEDWQSLSEDQILMLWKEKQEAITAAKAEELALRKYIVDRAFPAKHEGMNNKDLGEGYTLKAGVKFNYNLADNDIVEETLNEIEKVGNQGKFIADRLVSWHPAFLLTEYRALQEESEKGSIDAKKILALVNKMLTIDDAAPSLEIKAPKEKKK